MRALTRLTRNAPVQSEFPDADDHHQPHHHAVGQAHPDADGGQRTNHAMTPDEVEALDDRRAKRRAGHRSRSSSRQGDRRSHDGCDEKTQRVDCDRTRRTQRRRSDSAEKRAGYPDDSADTHQGACRVGDGISADKRRYDAEGGCVEEHEQRRSAERDEQEVGNRHRSEQVCRRDTCQRAYAGKLSRQQHPFSIDPVGEGAGQQPEQQIGQGFHRERDAGQQR